MLHVAGLLAMMLNTAWLQAGDVVAGIATSASTPAPVGQHGRWQLLFSDEFDGPSLDGAKWVTCYWWNRDGCTNLGNHELQWYRPQNVAVAGGQLHLRAQRETVQGHEGADYDYTSGLVSTGRDVENLSHPAKFVFRYGYAEMRARVPAGRGLFPAFWMLPANHESRPEIDVMEVIGQEPGILHTYFHYRAAGGERRQGTDSPVGDLSAGWHVFAADWQPGRIVWYLDGVERWRYEDANHIPNEPMYMLVNLAVGGKWPGPPDDSTRLPAEFLIDYVRVWRRID
jgi:beta-glucanase (GH16 family)